VRALDISFVIPILNEERYLDATLESLAAQELGDFSAEVLLVDGGSTDGSAAIVERYTAKQSGIQFRLLANPRRRTPAAFNIGIAESRSEIIGLGGAHTIYPSAYFRVAIELLRSGIAEVVGGGHDSHVPSVRSVLGRSMACLYLSPMGSGVAAYHRRTEPGFVDTVYGGFYRRDAFTRIGVFDESLTRNQDNELNARILRAGMRIYFDPRLSTQYVMKADVGTFLRRGYLFGRYHPETWRRTPGAFRFRHAAPAALALYTAVAAIASLVFRTWLPLWPLALYAVLLLAAALQLARTRPISVALLTIPLFAAYHFAYGTGTLVGLIRDRVPLPKSRSIASP
jgi:glycosyltransferase involved in cell wall biosynthesis